MNKSGLILRASLTIVAMSNKYPETFEALITLSKHVSLSTCLNISSISTPPVFGLPIATRNSLPVLIAKVCAASCAEGCSTEVVITLVPGTFSTIALTILNITCDAVSSHTIDPVLAPNMTSRKSVRAFFFVAWRNSAMLFVRSGQSGICSICAFASTAALSLNDPPEFSKNKRFLPV